MPPEAVEDLTFVKDLVYRVVKSAKDGREEGSRRAELQKIEQQNALLQVCRAVIQSVYYDLPFHFQARTAYYEISMSLP